MADVASTTGKAKSFVLSTAATTNSSVIKAAPGRVYTVYVLNQVAAVRNVKLFDKATAATLGTDKPVLQVSLPATVGATQTISIPEGVRFSNGIAIAVIIGTGIDADTSALATANDTKVVVNYS